MKQLLLSCLTCLLLPTLGMAGEADSTFTPHTGMEKEEVKIGKKVDENVEVKVEAKADEKAEVKETEAKADEKKKKSLITRFLDYFNDANKKNDKRFDFSIIGGPHYATDTKLGLGLVAAGIYRSDPADTLLLPSNVSLFGDVSTVGFYLLGVRGTHIFPHNRYRAVYTLYFYSFPCKFWGMGYDMGDNDDNKSDMKRWQVHVKGSFLWNLGSNLFLGPSVAYDYIIGKDIERPELLAGMDRHTDNYGVGFTFMFDNRDNLTYPHRGYYVNLTQMFRPRFLGNDYAFSTTELQLNAYQQLWRGAVLADGPSFHTQLWQSLVGHDGTDRRQQCPARILRGKIPRQTHDRSHCRTSPARVETQLAHGLDRRRNRLPQVQPDEKPSHPAQLWCGLSMGIQEERQRASRLWFRQGRTERIPLQYQRSILKEYFWS